MIKVYYLRRLSGRLGHIIYKNYPTKVPNYPVSIALHRDSLGRDILNCQIANIKTGFLFFSLPPDMHINFDDQIFGEVDMKAL